VSDVYAAANLESLESATVRKWCERWLETKSINISAPVGGLARSGDVSAAVAAWTVLSVVRGITGKSSRTI